MSGHGGHKHRQKKLNRKRSRKKRLGAENIARVKARFEAKGQAWDPAKNAVQTQALNHHGRRVALARVLPA
jgi:hypothetical protein